MREERRRDLLAIIPTVTTENFRGKRLESGTIPRKEESIKGLSLNVGLVAKRCSSKEKLGIE
jgi:hypothetical protein